VPKADNQKTVQFVSAPQGPVVGTGVGYWGVYSVPSQIISTLGPLHVALVNGKAVISWTGAGTLESTSDLRTGPTFRAAAQVRNHNSCPGPKAVLLVLHL